MSANNVPRDENCIFCRIVAGEAPADLVAESDNAIAINDINPDAPLHALVIPKGHYVTVGDLAKAAPEQVGELVSLAVTVANQQADGNYRLIFNNGASAGQGVFHAHGHVVGGKPLGWHPSDSPSH